MNIPMGYTIACFALLCLACGSSNDEPTGGEKPSTGGSGEAGGVSDVRTVKSSLTVDLTTDRAIYAPGETVTLTASDLPTDAIVRYRRGFDTVKEEAMSSTQWQWTAPATDFTGYLVDIYRLGADGSETVLGTIAVDVSSDWTRFPRYGFVASFDASKLADGQVEAEMDFLNRCHINGVQFQDWHYKHHWPLGGTPGNLMDCYTDIANRDVYTSVVKHYIDVQHRLGMKSMFYNLCFGALEDAAADGVKEEWYAFKTPNRSDKDVHSLPSSWKSSIYLLNPANPEWQEYIGQRNDDVYASLDFDGYQIDQLGNRGDLYDYSGNKLNLPNGYASFIDAMKARHPSKRLVMNAVSSYGASMIVGTGKVDFCYNEVWGDEAQFKDLHTIIKTNDLCSNHTLATVFAAYMNYDKAGRTTGEFNTPGVLMADAVMMALGGSHLELGDHMLSREYFPTAPLSMPSELTTAIVRYYDFMTAYENYLRGATSQAEFTPDIRCGDDAKGIDITAWPPKQGGITAYARTVAADQVISLLNFRNIDNLSWRDLDGTRPAPLLTLNLPVAVKCSKKATRVWTASPDYHGGAPVELAFTQADGELTFTLPTLKYWAMIVIE